MHAASQEKTVGRTCMLFVSGIDTFTCLTDLILTIFDFMGSLDGVGINVLAVSSVDEDDAHEIASS